MLKKKLFVVVMAALVGVSLVLAGCPTGDNVSYEGETYSDRAVLVNEADKYQTAVVFEFDESDAGKDVTGQLIQLLPGKSADRDVRVSISGAAEGNYFGVYKGRLLFTGRMPISQEEYQKAYSDLQAKIEEEENGDQKAALQKLLDEMDGVSNTEVITLSFQKGETVSTLDVLAVIYRKGETPPQRSVADVLSSFLIYGYDVINSGYINRNDVKRGAPMLDAAKVDAAGLLIHDTSATSSAWSSTSGETVVELLEKINAAASAAYKGVLFSGKIEAEFSTSTSSKTTTRYAKGQGFHIAREDFLAKSTARSLKNYLDDDFVADINAESAAYILRAYGTHLLTGCLLGGEAEFNYSYHGTELNDETKITAALNATFAGFSSAASGGYQTQMNELKNNSAFTSSSRGGNNTAFMTAEQFTSGYAAWVASVEAKPDLCGIPSFDRLLPIWELAAQVNPAKAEAIQAEFEDMVVRQGIKLAGFKYEPERSYVTAIDVFKDSGTPTNHGDYTHLVKNNMYSSESGEVMGIGGGYYSVSETLTAVIYNSYIAYFQAAGNSHNAIAELMINSNTTSLGGGWQVINLNFSAGSYPLYLHYRKVNQNDTQAIDFIGGYEGTSPGSGQILSGYEWVSAVGMMTQDLNGGYVSWSTTGDRFNLLQSAYTSNKYIYLTVRKVPFKW